MRLALLPNHGPTGSFFQREPSGAVVTPNVNRVPMTISMSQAGYEQLGSAGLCDKTISKLREELIHGPRCTPEDG